MACWQALCWATGSSFSGGWRRMEGEKKNQKIFLREEQPSSCCHRCEEIVWVHSMPKIATMSVHLWQKLDESIVYVQPLVILKGSRYRPGMQCIQTCGTLCTTILNFSSKRAEQASKQAKGSYVHPERKCITLFARAKSLCRSQYGPLKHFNGFQTPCTPLRIYYNYLPSTFLSQ